VKRQHGDKRKGEAIIRRGLMTKGMEKSQKLVSILIEKKKQN
jgi:hypothetical protein